MEVILSRSTRGAPAAAAESAATIRGAFCSYVNMSIARPSDSLTVIFKYI